LTGTAFGDVVVGFCFLVRPLFGFIHKPAGKKQACEKWTLTNQRSAFPVQ
jgi:hypothetical protein